MSSNKTQTLENVLTLNNILLGVRNFAPKREMIVAQGGFVR